MCYSPRGYSPEAVSLVEFHANENQTVGKLKTLGAKNNLSFFGYLISVWHVKYDFLLLRCKSLYYPPHIKKSVISDTTDCSDLEKTGFSSLFSTDQL